MTERNLTGRVLAELAAEEVPTNLLDECLQRGLENVYDDEDSRQEVRLGIVREAVWYIRDQLKGLV